MLISFCVRARPPTTTYSSFCALSSVPNLVPTHHGSRRVQQPPSDQPGAALPATPAATAFQRDPIPNLLDSIVRRRSQGTPKFAAPSPSLLAFLFPSCITHQNGAPAFSQHFLRFVSHFLLLQSARRQKSSGQRPQPEPQAERPRVRSQTQRGAAVRAFPLLWWPLSLSSPPSPGGRQTGALAATRSSPDDSARCYSRRGRRSEAGRGGQK